MDGSALLGMEHRVDGPLESRDIPKVRIVGARREGLDEVRERRAVLEQTGAGGWMASNVRVSREAEEAAVHQPAHHRIRRRQRLRQAREDVVPVELYPRF